jgi:hypothetical protein
LRPGLHGLSQSCRRGSRAGRSARPAQVFPEVPLVVAHQLRQLLVERSVELLQQRARLGEHARVARVLGVGLRAKGGGVEGIRENPGVASAHACSTCSAQLLRTHAQTRTTCTAPVRLPSSELPHVICQIIHAYTRAHTHAHTTPRTCWFAFFCDVMRSHSASVRSVMPRNLSTADRCSRGAACVCEGSSSVVLQSVGRHCRRIGPVLARPDNYPAATTQLPCSCHPLPGSLRCA